MKTTIILATLALGACAHSQPDWCDKPLTTLDWRENCQPRDGAAKPAKAVKPTTRPEPEPTPVDVTPEPKPVDPPARVNVCDGGARACRDGESPTGYEGNPKGYL